MKDQARFDGLDSPTLTNLLLNPAQRPEVHKAALSSLSRRSSDDRTRRLLDILKTVVENPQGYDQQVMAATIDILATDPDSKATEAMLALLPTVLHSRGLTKDFREYFFEALVTRQREDDLAVWRAALPHLNGDALVAMLFDTAAKPLADLEPLRLIQRLPSDERASTLRRVFLRALFTRPPLAWASLSMLFGGKAASPGR